MAEKNKDLLGSALKECRLLFAGAIGLSLVINLLSLAVPLYSMQVLDRVLSSGSKSTLMFLSLIVVAAIICSGLITALRSIAFTQISRWLDDKLSTEIVHKSIGLALRRPGIGAQPLRDLNTIRSFIASPTMGSLLDAPWAIIFFAVLYMINPIIGVVVAISAVVLLGLAILAHKIPSKLLASMGEAQVKSMQSLEAVLRNAEVVSAMGMATSATKNWRVQNDKSLTDGYAAGNIGTAITNFTKTFRMGLQILTTGLGAWLVINGQMSMGAIIAVNILTGKALAPFDASVAIYQGLTNVKKARKRLDAVFDFDERSDAQIELPTPIGHLELSNLGYQDAKSKRWLIKGVDLTCPAGSSFGIIGPSGGGKTTLARLLVGVKMPTSGSIRLDGGVLAQWRHDQRAEAIGYLPQDVELFAGTIAQNIARMQEGAEDASIVAAAQLAEVHDFILSLPDGYQTEIGDQGAALSAGQRQRIALARCFFGTPKVIILDEPNSNLDTEGEQALVKALLNARDREITVIIITHRPSLLHHMDNIAVIKGGEIVRQGPAKDMLEKMAAQNASVKPLKIDRAS